MCLITLIFPHVRSVVPFSMTSVAQRIILSINNGMLPYLVVNLPLNRIILQKYVQLTTTQLAFLMITYIHTLD